MIVHVWKMRARRKKAEEYEKFGRQVTLAALKKIDGCLDAHFVKVYEARKPEYFWLVFWKDYETLEAARSHPAWREQIRKFETGNFYKTIPLELVCETLASFAAPGGEKPRKTEKTEKEDETGKGSVAPASSGA